MRPQRTIKKMYDDVIVPQTHNEWNFPASFNFVKDTF